MKSATLSKRRSLAIPSRSRNRATSACVGLLALALLAMAASPALAVVDVLRIENYATMPLTGSTAFPSATANSAYLARVNFMRDDPADPNRFVVNDLNGQMYFLDKTTRTFTEYLNFNGRSGGPGLFDRLWTSAGFAGGLVTFQFDPGYADSQSPGYGKFYTAHVEQGTSGSQTPGSPNFPNLDTSNYGVTAPVAAPGPTNYQMVLVEWADTNVTNTTFEGSARELLRLNARDRIHPLGDIIFNPTAGPEDDDWRMMYVAIGDAGAGEQTDAALRRTPQLLNGLGGKILRIAPDDDVNITTTLSPNGKYYIPTDNPFTGVADPGGDNGSVRDEIWALGLRNPHRLAWDVDPQISEPETSLRLLVNDIGYRTWEEVSFIQKGANYGYSQREGNQSLSSTNVIGPIPNPDTIPNELICSGTSFSTCTSNGTVTPVYPVIQYGHGLAGQDQLIAGDSISSGFVYRGTQIPQLYGKYLFGDITTGAIFYADYDEMLAVDDGDPSTLAEIHSVDILWDNPNDAPDDGEELYTTIVTMDPEPDAILGPMHQIVRAGYVARGGLDENLPGGAAVTGPNGRADIRIAVDSSGELYILSKSDGMIRAIVGPDPIPGDYNYDGLVDALDYQTWKEAYGGGVPMVIPYAGWGPDGNGDGRVDAGDYVYWRNRLPGDLEGGGGLVPEPTGTVMCMLAAAGLALVRPRLRVPMAGS